MQRKITTLTTQLGKNLIAKKLTIVTAESCSGGGLAYYISLNKESSASLERGYVIYSLQSKEELLKVSPNTLQTHGTVSKEVAIEMAKGALKKSCAQISIAITGIAGEEKNKKMKKKSPGLVFIACSNNLDKLITYKLQISGSRAKFCESIIIESLNILINYIKKYH